jgi:hypothetical protein
LTVREVNEVGISDRNNPARIALVESFAKLSLGVDCVQIIHRSTPFLPEFSLTFNSSGKTGYRSARIEKDGVLAGVGPVLVVRSFPMGRLALAIFFTSRETFYRLGTLITQDLVVASKATFIKSVGKGRKLTVAGKLAISAV